MHRSFFALPDCLISPQSRRLTLKFAEVPAVTYDQSPLSCQLDALETSPHSTDETPSYGPLETSLDVGVDFRHSGWAENRRRVQHALEALEASEARRARFDSCGRHAWILQSVDDPEVFKIACDRCRDRFCVPCARERSRHIASRVGDFAAGKQLRFITLTLRHTARTMKEDIDRLYAGFVKLRRRRVWAKTQKGGVGFLEIKRAESGAGWHVHMHTIVEGYNIENRDLAAAWHEITGDSFIVDIKWCHSPEQAAFYAAKYSGKGIHGDCYKDPEVLRDSMAGIKGRRLVAKFGTWRVLDLKADTDESEWRGVDSLRRMLTRSANGDPEAQQILTQLKGGTRCNTEPRSPPDHSFSPSLFGTNHAVPDVLSSSSQAS